MDWQHVHEIERHARVRGWIVVRCPRCERRASDKHRECCDGLRRVLTFANALGEISFQQYEAMHIVQGLEKRPFEAEPKLSQRVRAKDPHDRRAPTSREAVRAGAAP
jgi:hypothetical protein